MQKGLLNKTDVNTGKISRTLLSGVVEPVWPYWLHRESLENTFGAYMDPKNG